MSERPRRLPARRRQRPEVMAEGVQVLLRALPLELELTGHDSGIAIDRHGIPLQEGDASKRRLGADAVAPRRRRLCRRRAKPSTPEQGLIPIRKELGRLREPAPREARRRWTSSSSASSSAAYYGARGRRHDGTAFDTCEYAPGQIERVAA